MNEVKGLLWLCLLFVCLNGCARIEVMDAGIHSVARAPTVANDIFIYRSQRPQWKYQEIGLVSVKGIDNIKLIYNEVRQVSSTKGAHGVIDFDLESEEVTSTSTSTSCTPNGACTTSTSVTTSIIYAASGTLILRSKV